jgi:DsbC/DsbD-like thiol-disulfide interchange protein
MRLTTPLLTLAIAAAPCVASASSSDWLESEGGRVRIVTTGQADDAGVLRGALEVDLLPGWKTYWRDPGEAGVPPTIDLGDAPSVTISEMGFPAPKRFDDGYSKWAGYKHSVSLPLTFKFDRTGTAEPIAASVFIGICETICIPVQGELDVDPASDPDNADDKAVVEAALDALPSPASDDFGASIVEKADDALTVVAQAPGAPETTDLFLASASGYVFGTPERVVKDGKLSFSVPILDRPEEASDSASFHYTLVSGEQAVEGTLALP